MKREGDNRRKGKGGRREGDSGWERLLFDALDVNLNNGSLYLSAAVFKLQCMPRTVKRVLDKNLTFHKAVAWTIIAASAMHIMAHYYNYERIAAAVRLNKLNNTEGVRLLPSGTVRLELLPANISLV